MSKIVIIGAAILDILVQPCDESVFKTGSYPCEAIGMSVGGDALNEATILGYCDKDVRLICTMGKDSTSSYLMDHCKKVGIKVDDSCCKDDLQTGINVVLVKEDGSRHFLTNKNGSLRKLSLQDIPLNFTGDILCFASIFVFPEIQDEQLYTIFNYAKSQNMIIAADMTKCKHNETINDYKQSLPLIDYLFPNEQEAMLFTREDSVEKCADALYKSGVKNVVIKCGAKGCYVKNKDISSYFGVERQVTCVDTTGAGDSFVAGFIKALSEKKTLEECIKLANIFGSYNIEHIGATDWFFYYE